MSDLKFKPNAEPVPMTDNFWYMLNNYIEPEDLLESADDVQKVNDAIAVLRQFEEEGIDQGFFEEI